MAADGSSTSHRLLAGRKPNSGVSSSGIGPARGSSSSQGSGLRSCATRAGRRRDVVPHSPPRPLAAYPNLRRRLPCPLILPGSSQAPLRSAVSQAPLLPSGNHQGPDTCCEGTWTFLHRPTLRYASSRELDGMRPGYSACRPASSLARQLTAGGLPSSYPTLPLGMGSPAASSIPRPCPLLPYAHLRSQAPSGRSQESALP